jgi:DNA-binding PadR family transcriptional regulator
MHGYSVTRRIRERTSGTIDIEDTPLYKSLHRLERAASSISRGAHRAAHVDPAETLRSD